MQILAEVGFSHHESTGSLIACIRTVDSRVHICGILAWRDVDSHSNLVLNAVLASDHID